MAVYTTNPNPLGGRDRSLMILDQLVFIVSPRQSRLHSGALSQKAKLKQELDLERCLSGYSQGPRFSS